LPKKVFKDAFKEQLCSALPPRLATQRTERTLFLATPKQALRAWDIPSRAGGGYGVKVAAAYMRGLESRRPGVAANGTTPARTDRRRFAARAGGGAPTAARERESGVSRAAAAVGQRTRTRIHTHRCGPSSSRFLEAGPDVARETENADLRPPACPAVAAS